MNTTRCGRARNGFLLVLAVLVITSGCAGSRGGSGRQLLRRGDYPGAVQKLREEEAGRPSDAAVKRDLGVALHQAGDPDAAWQKLSRAREIDPRDARTLFFSGRAAEATGRTAAALDAYAAYLAAGKVSRKGRAAVRARMEALTQELAVREIRRAIAREDSLRAARVPENSVAVSDFLNAAGSDTLAPLSKGLAAMVVTDLARVRRLRVLERERIRVLQDELKLGSEGIPQGSAPTGPVPDSWADWAANSTTLGMKQRLQAVARPGGLPYYDGPLDENKDAAYTDAVKRFQNDHGLTADGVPGPRTRQALEKELEGALALRQSESGRGTGARPAPRRAVDPATAPRLGRLLGARRFVQGSFLPVEDSGIELDAALISVPDGALTPAAKDVRGELRDVLRLEKRLVYQILGALGIEAEPDERQAIDRLPTRSFLAFLAFSRGIDFEERGLPAEALRSYQEAVRLDPRFEVARVREEIRSVTAEDQSALEQGELRRLGPTAGSTRERIVRTGTANSLGAGPEVDRGQETNVAVTPANRIDVMGEIVVEGDLPEEGKR